MPDRIKTIEYAWDVEGDSILLRNTNYTSPTKIIYIPETGSREITSCWLETCMRDSSALTSARSTIGSSSLVVNVNGVKSNTYYTNGSTAFNDSGESQFFILNDNITDFARTHFTSSAFSLSLQYAYSASGNSNANYTNFARKLYITYTYNDDDTARRIKTVKIPFDNYLAGTISTTISPMPSVANAGQIPALNTFCPENDKNFRDIWIEFSGTERQTTSGTTDDRLTASIDNGPLKQLGFFEAALASLTDYKSFYNISNINTATTHSLWMRRIGTNNYQEIVAVLHVTYDYNHDNSTRILNSVESSFNFPGFYGFPEGTNYTIHKFPFIIPEDNPTLKQSGVAFLYTGTAAAPVSRIMIGTASIGLGGRSYNINSTWGYAKTMLRFDVSSSYYPVTASMPGFRRGKSILQANYTTTLPQRTIPPTGIVYLNYESDKHNLGDGVHNHTIRRLQVSGSIYGTAGYATLLNDNLTDNTLPESDYYINFHGYEMNHLKTATNPFAARTVYFPISPDHCPEDYYSKTVHGTYVDLSTEDGVPFSAQASEMGMISTITPDQSGIFRKYPGQLSSSLNPREGCLNPQATRSFTLTGDSTRMSFSDVITYNAITFPVTGTVSGYSGDGSGIEVVLHDATSGKSLKKTTTTTGGAYTMSWYDPTQQLYVESIQDNTKTGRSANGTV